MRHPATIDVKTEINTAAADISLTVLIVEL